MPDLSPQPPHPQADRTAGANGDGADPLAKLHRMSRTAGLGTQDYVAINVAAVVSALLGLASVLALVTSLLLVIPVAGVICGLVALYQIKDSNGTQTGAPAAWVGILLSVLFAALVGGRVVLDNMRTRSDREQVIAAVDEFGRKLAASDFRGAYDTFSKRLQDRVPFSEFEAQMRSRYAHERHGKITSLRSKGRVMIETDAESGARFATTQLRIEMQHAPPDEPTMMLVNEGPGWRIEAWGWFPPRPQQISPAGR